MRPERGTRCTHPLTTVLIVAPTLVLLGMLVVGGIQRRNGLIALGLSGLFLYAFMVIMLDTLQRTVRGQHHYDGAAKLFNGYFGVLLVAVIIGSIYLMGHH